MRPPSTADSDDVYVAQCDFVPRTPPTSVSAVATWAPSIPSAASSLVMTPPTSSYPLVHIAAPPPATSRRIPLTIQVRKVRILLVAVAFVVLLLLLIARVNRGVILTTGSFAQFRVPKVRRQREDDLNFYFGTALSLLTKVFEVAALFMLPIVVLTLLTERSMMNDAFYWRLGFLLLQGVFIALLMNAFSTTYVTAGDPTITHWIMTERDLVAASPLVAAPGLDVSRPDAPTPRRAISDTMFRTALLPAYARAPRRGKCTFGHSSNQSVAVRFGFHTSEALQGLAENGVPLNGSINLSVGDWLGEKTTTVKPGRMPHNLTTAANLAIHALNFMVDRLRMPLLSASTVDPLQVYARRATLANDTAAFLRATAEMLNASLAPQDEFGFYFAPAQAKIQFSSHARGSVQIDAVTLTLPFQRGMLQRSLVATQFDTLRDDKRFDPETNGEFLDGNGDAVFQVFPQEECGTRGCWLRKPSASKEADAVWNMRPEVAAYSRCVATLDAIGASELEFTACTEDKIVNDSVVVGAIGSTLLADRFVEFESDGFARDSGRIRRANVTNLRRVMSVTLAFVTWRVEELIKLYDQTVCAADSTTQCHGLWYPATNASDVLVDSRHLIADELNTIASDLLAGQPLVSLVTDLRGGSFLAFTNVEHGVEQVAEDGSVSAIDPTAPQTRWPCARDIELIADSIVFNRWYIDHSLQEAYTAALYHVFQFGVRHLIIEPNDVYTLETRRHIDLFGNVAEYEFVASIPEKAALISLLSGVLFLVSVCVVVCAGKRRECAINDSLDVHRVARVHLVEQFFPKVFLKCTVFTTPQGQPLEPFRVVAMRLHQRAPDGDVFVTLPAPINLVNDSMGLSDVEQGLPQRAFTFEPVQPVGDYYHVGPLWTEPSR